MDVWMDVWMKNQINFVLAHLGKGQLGVPACILVKDRTLTSSSPNTAATLPAFFCMTGSAFFLFASGAF
jgi:hypothetical protein